MEVSLCHNPISGSCPVVNVKPNEVTIGEAANIVRLNAEEWNILVEKIKSGELKKV